MGKVRKINVISFGRGGCPVDSGVGGFYICAGLENSLVEQELLPCIDLVNVAGITRGCSGNPWPFFGVRMELVNDQELMLQVVKLFCIAGIAALSLFLVCLCVHLRKDIPFVKHKKEEWEKSFENWLHKHCEKAANHS